ncbi:Zinc finger, CCHC-type [Plasmopara halstedii]|uniref:Zinc finger, CCHC-type n=1 Tax=Plasmopara halstedii TaxID=4781 RepID=A0A0P1AEG8_PLAHL|nr:Zinc finger, CCHC-type [Plasmopara halstedii]CEG39273.1 Zinc finger, CCHC-type [Plasmopara halstedii]|eukprot:XP_024575642.1 Zinc finger, CCHC-type [Plasmopara halstedii]
MEADNAQMRRRRHNTSNCYQCGQPGHHMAQCSQRRRNQGNQRHGRRQDNRNQRYRSHQSRNTNIGQNNAEIVQDNGNEDSEEVKMFAAQEVMFVKKKSPNQR